MTRRTLLWKARWKYEHWLYGREPRIHLAAYRQPPFGRVTTCGQRLADCPGEQVHDYHVKITCGRCWRSIEAHMRRTGEWLGY